MTLESLLPWLSPVVAASALAHSIVSSRRKDQSARIEKLETRVDRGEDRATRLETELKHLPDTNTTHRLEVALMELKSEVAVVNASMRPIAAMADRIQEVLVERVAR